MKASRRTRPRPSIFSHTLPGWLTSNYPEASAIIRVVIERTRIPAYELLGARRWKRVAQARGVAMTLCYDLLGFSMPEVGAIFNRDHTTVLHATRVHRGTLLHHQLLADAKYQLGIDGFAAPDLHVVFRDPPEADGQGDGAGVFAGQRQGDDGADAVRR